MSPEKYLDLKERLIAEGYAAEVDWASSIKPCADSEDFFMEYVWVVLNSDMKEQIARKIWKRILQAIVEGKRAASVFGHKGKAEAIDKMRIDRKERFADYQNAPDKFAFLRSLPWIGPITQYHLAKNLGHDCVKPDRHLVRIAGAEGKTPDQLCRELANQIGDKFTTVDTVLWRAANLGMI